VYHSGASLQAMVNVKWSMVNGQLTIDHWTLTIEHLTLTIEHLSQDSVILFARRRRMNG
jgi:hypothetical protein